MSNPQERCTVTINSTQQEDRVMIKKKRKYHKKTKVNPERYLVFNDNSGNWEIFRTQRDAEIILGGAPPDPITEVCDIIEYLGYEPDDAKVHRIKLETC